MVLLTHLVAELVLWPLLKLAGSLMQACFGVVVVPTFSACRLASISCWHDSGRAAHGLPVMLVVQISSHGRVWTSAVMEADAHARRVQFSSPLGSSHGRAVPIFEGVSARNEKTVYMTLLDLEPKFESEVQSPHHVRVHRFCVVTGFSAK